MSEVRVKKLTAGFAIGGISIVTIVALGLWGCHGPGAAPGNPPPEKAAANPPVIVVGGTIHGKAGGWDQDANQTPETEYIGQSSNSTLLYTVDVTGVTSSITDTQGWVINVYDQDYKGVMNPVPAVQMCSDESCQHSSVDQTNNYVYLRARQNSVFEQSKAGRLHFHDLSPNCDDYPKSRTESTCDSLLEVGIITGGPNGTEKQYSCGPANNPHHCRVYVGAPPK